MKSEEQNNTRGFDVAHAAADTLAIHADKQFNGTSAVSPPIYQTATFRADSNEEFAQMALNPRHPQHELARRQMSGFTGILSFELKGGFEAAKRLVTGVRLASYAASIGGTESLIVCPAIMLAHQMSEEQFEKVGVRPGLVRLSVGLEDERDLISDLEQALASV